jgi:hypothetical protein
MNGSWAVRGSQTTAVSGRGAVENHTSTPVRDHRRWTGNRGAGLTDVLASNIRSGSRRPACDYLTGSRGCPPNRRESTGLAAEFGGVLGCEQVEGVIGERSLDGIDAFRPVQHQPCGVRGAA